MTKRRYFRAAIVLSACGAVACQWLADISQRDYQDQPTLDASIVADSAPPPDPCAHATPPPLPTLDSDPAIQETYILAAEQFDFSGRDDAGHAKGFDIDHVCTCDHDPLTAYDGASSCILPSTRPKEGGCDDPNGVDNVVVDGVFNFNYVNSVNSTTDVNKNILCGIQGVLFYLGGYNGLANDQQVEFGPIIGSGIQPHDGGEVDAGCDPLGPGLAGPFPPKWDGTDVWAVDPRSLFSTTNEPVRPATTAYVNNWQLVVPPGGNPLPLQVGPLSLEISAPTIVATLVPLEADGSDAKYGASSHLADGRLRPFRMKDGLFAGRLSTKFVLSALSALKINHEPLCGSSLFYAAFKNFVCSARDIMSDPQLDFRPGSVCDGISAGVGFSARPAQIGPRILIENPEGGCGGNWVDECPASGGASDASR